MTLAALASGRLLAAPVRRNGTRACFTTAALRAASGAETVVVNVIAFGGIGDQLAELEAGDQVSVCGLARLTEWTASDRATRHGLSIAAEQIMALKPQAARRRRSPRRKTLPPAAGDLLNDPVNDLYAEGER
jgi:hypothetical protein